jgi:hypothetical protein
MQSGNDLTLDVTNALPIACTVYYRLKSQKE